MGGRTSAASKNKWNAANYDRINFVIEKGKKEMIKAHADQQGESVNAFIKRAIENQIERDNGK